MDLSSAVESARAPSRDVSFCNRLLLNRDGDGDRPNKYSSIHTYIYSMEQYDELISILGSVTKYEGAIHRKMNTIFHIQQSYLAKIVMNGRNSLFLLFPKGPAEVSSFPKKFSTSSLFESFLRYDVSLTVIIRNHWGDLTVIQNWIIAM